MYMIIMCLQMFNKKLKYMVINRYIVVYLKLLIRYIFRKIVGIKVGTYYTSFNINKLLLNESFLHRRT